MQASLLESCSCSYQQLHRGGAKWQPVQLSRRLGARTCQTQKRCPSWHLCRASAESRTESQAEGAGTSGVENGVGQASQSTKKDASIDKEVSKFARSAATTFAPRASTASKNPAYKGSVLYTVFEVQAWLFLVLGGLLSFNVIFPSDEPSIARLIGMWSIWMFTVPALRARDCSAAEKDALNYLFLLIPVLNVALPFVWKNFAFIYSADVVALAALYAWKVGLPEAEEAS